MCIYNEYKININKKNMNNLFKIRVSVFFSDALSMSKLLKRRGKFVF